MTLQTVSWEVLHQALLQPSGEHKLLVPLSSFVSWDFSFVAEGRVSHAWNWWQCQPWDVGSSSVLQAGKQMPQSVLTSSLFSGTRMDFFPKGQHPLKLQHWCALNKYNSCHDVTLQPNTQGKHMSGANEAVAPSQGDVTLWEGQLKLFCCSLPLPSHTGWGVCFQFPSVAERFWGARSGVKSVVTHAQHPLQMGRRSNSE